MTEKNVPVKDTKLRFVKRYAFLVLDRATRSCKRFFVMNTTAQGEQMNLFTSIRNLFSVKADNIYSQTCPFCHYTTTSPSFDMYDSGQCDRCGEYWFEHPSELEKIAEYEAAYEAIHAEDIRYCKCGAHIVGTPCYMGYGPKGEANDNGVPF
jgi:Zn-finger nucleic acid-binding protein